MRPLYLYKGTYPATITSVRGTTWHPDNLEGTQEQLEAWGLESPITGHIPQVSQKLLCTASITHFECPMIYHMRLLRDPVSRKNTSHLIKT